MDSSLMDSDTLYLSGAQPNGGRSFTSYSLRDRSLYDNKYPSILANDRYSTAAAVTTTSNTSSLYRPSMFTSSASSNPPLLNKLTSQSTSTPANHHHTHMGGSSNAVGGAGGTGSGGGAATGNNISGQNLYSSTLTSTTTTTANNNHHHLATSNPAASAFDNLISSNTSFRPTGESLHHHHDHQPPVYGATSAAAAAAAVAASHKPPTLPGGINSTTGGTGLLSSTSRVQSSLGQHLLQQLFDDMRQIEDTVDSIEIPARGRCKVYMAKYGYDPFKQSPNDNPDAELAFNAGDYIMVFDDIDEDGYFIGELMDGRRGYVPSNWLERLTGEDLFEFQASTLYKQQHKDDESESNSYPPEFYDAIVSETMNHSNFQHLLAPEDYHRMNDYVDLDDVNEVDDECLSDYERAEAEQMCRAVPPPIRLLLERQLNKSILISWLHPQAAKGTIVSYQVYVDGVLKSTVPSGDRTKALLEGVDSNIPHRISVRAIDLHGRHSNDAGCTIVIGQKIPFAPSCVKASHITSDSALISWLPCNSNFHHVVAVNSVEVQTVRPSVYKHLINGLSANTLYRVWVRAKPGKILSIDEKNPKKLESLTTYVDFKTMPKSLPDPPVNVQVEAGPQRRTLLVSWLPLTLNDFGSSNGCAVTGYAVFAGHKKLADIDSPTGDHALLDLSDLESLHKKSVTVRTKSGENLSQDSMPCHIPDEYLKAAAASKSDHLNNHNNSNNINQRHISSSQSQSRHRLSDTSVAGGRHSPSRHPAARYNAAPDQIKYHQSPHHYQQQQQSQRLPGHQRYASGLRGRQMTRSLQNLESDLESRRSSIPAIEVTRETSGSDLINNQTESYSEEEFESSMRFRGMRGKPGMRAGSRYRPRQSHSVDSSVPHLSGKYNQQQLAYNSLTAKLRGTPIEQQQRDIRYFVALFDYDPSTMSPNPNAASEELAFKEGSIIKVIGDKGPDGFYRGELDNHVGFVPCNVVSEITGPNLLYNLQEKNNLNRQLIQGATLQAPTGATNYHRSNPQQQQQPLANPQQQQQQQQLDPQQQQQQQSGVKRMAALYDYDPQGDSPNPDLDSEIPFKAGDVIYVYGKMDTDGFYMGEVERTKQRGLVPSNFLREDPLPAQQQTANKQQQQQLINMNQQQPQATQMQQFNQMGAAGDNQMVQPMMDAFSLQQQRQPNPNQFIGGNSVQQQQQLNKMNNNIQQMQRGPNIRGILPQPQTNQQSINRPTSLSLGLNSAANPTSVGNLNDWNSNPRQQLMNQPQQQQQQQQQQNMQQMPLQNNQMPMNQQQQQPFNQSGVNQFGGNMVQPVSQMQGQPQGQQQMMSSNQQQQQAGGGVLSNLLSSGKQIIGAATTPRVPNQPGQFPPMNQAMGGGGGGIQGGVNAGLGGVNSSSGQMMVDGVGVGNYGGNRGNLMQAAFNPNDSSQPIHNSFSMAGNQMHGQPQLQQQQLQQQQHHQYNQMGLNRGPMAQMGEEQGGNILNTVKNMFKL